MLDEKKPFDELYSLGWPMSDQQRPVNDGQPAPLVNGNGLA